MLFSEIVEQKRFAFYDRAPDWRTAITMACRPLVAGGFITDEYAGSIIRCVEELGPYIVIVPNVAIPHSVKGAQGVLKTTVGFAKFAEPVVFHDSDSDEDKPASVFFTLAALNEDEHLKNMRQLFRALSDEQLLEEIQRVSEPEQLIELEQRYFN